MPIAKGVSRTQVPASRSAAAPRPVSAPIARHEARVAASGPAGIARSLAAAGPLRRGGVPVNDDADLEKEVDAMGAKAASRATDQVARAGGPGATMPDNLKAGVEQLAGLDASAVKVHYNSPKPATLQAHAYAEGNEVFLAPGAEQFLAHEAWHVVQQAQGRVVPTKQA